MTLVATEPLAESCGTGPKNVGPWLDEKRARRRVSVTMGRSFDSESTRVQLLGPDDGKGQGEITS